MKMRLWNGRRAPALLHLHHGKILSIEFSQNHLKKQPTSGSIGGRHSVDVHTMHPRLFEARIYEHAPVYVL